MRKQQQENEKEEDDEEDCVQLEMTELSSNSNSTRVFYDKIYAEAEKLYKMHTKAFNFFQRLHLTITLPSILISGVSGILSFVATSKMITSEDTKNNIELSVGVISAIGLLLQSFSASLGYSAKRESHSIASSSYNNILTSVEFERKTLDDPSFITALEEKIREIKGKCNYPMPMWILNESNEDCRNF